MIRFRHLGCQSEAIRYVGQGAPGPGMVMRSAEWQLPDCTHPKNGVPVICPDCGAHVQPLGPQGIEPIPAMAEV